MASSHYLTVPDLWREPLGPYHKAPDSCGGEWWYVNPFTGPEPWKRLCADFVDPKGIDLKPGFIEIFGAEPVSESFHDAGGYSAFIAAHNAWILDLQRYKQPGWPLNSLPDWPEIAEPFDKIEELTLHWLGPEYHPRYYEGRYGWCARFPGSIIAFQDFAALPLLSNPHQIIAEAQIMLIHMGVYPENRHPDVPPQLWPDGSPLDPRHQ